MSRDRERRTEPLCAAVLERIDEQCETLARLMDRVPAGGEHQTPDLPSASFPAPRSIGELIEHLFDCLNGLGGTLHNLDPDGFPRLAALRPAGGGRNLRRPAAARARITVFAEAFQEAFQSLTDAELARIVPSPFVPGGETLLARLLINLEHLINHKHELFTYLKLIGVPLTTRDLYRFRGE